MARPHKGSESAHSRSRARSQSRVERLRAVPWTTLLQGGVVVGRRWIGLSPKDRARLTELIRASRGLPGNLSEKERRELRKIAGRLDLRGMGAELLALRRMRKLRRRH